MTNTIDLGVPVDTLLPFDTMSLSSIARVIRRDWTKVYFGAVPYLQALSELNSVSDNYGYDSGVSIVLYFLANANTWRGPVAKAVKAELKKRCK
jgi:hypothetical protein